MQKKKSASKFCLHKTFVLVAAPHVAGFTRNVSDWISESWKTIMRLCINLYDTSRLPFGGPLALSHGKAGYFKVVVEMAKRHNSSIG